MLALEHMCFLEKFRPSSFLNLKKSIISRQVPLKLLIAERSTRLYVGLSEAVKIH